MRRMAIRWMAAALVTIGVAGAQDLESAYKNLKDAEAKKDVDLVRKFAGETSKAARAVMATPQPEKADLNNLEVRGQNLEVKALHFPFQVLTSKFSVHFTVSAPAFAH